MTSPWTPDRAHSDPAGSPPDSRTEVEPSAEEANAAPESAAGADDPELVHSPTPSEPELSVPDGRMDTGGRRPIVPAEVAPEVALPAAEASARLAEQGERAAELPSSLAEASLEPAAKPLAVPGETLAAREETGAAIPAEAGERDERNQADEPSQAGGPGESGLAGGPQAGEGHGWSEFGRAGESPVGEFGGAGEFGRASEPLVGEAGGVGESPVGEAGGANESGEVGEPQGDKRSQAGEVGAGEVGGEEIESDELPELSDAELEPALEALLLVVDSPVEAEVLAGAVGTSAERVTATLGRMADDLTARGRGFDLRHAGGGWRLYTRDRFAPYVEKMLLDGQRAKLTRAALETLAVIAYRQPVTRSRVAAVRGVNCDGVIRTLLTRGLVEETGTDLETGGHLYRTSDLFLERLGLSSLDDLPPIAPLLPDVDSIDDV